MEDKAFTQPGRFWRGNLHTHSNRSDGVLDPVEVCRRYEAEGYDFLALTDHLVGLYDYPIVDTSPFRSARFTTILGAELHTSAMQNGEIWHILAVGLPEDFERPDVGDFTGTHQRETGPELAERARNAGAFVAIAHPEWSGQTMADARSITAAHAVEVYNHGCATGCDRGSGFYVLDQLLTEGKRLTLCATDDAHFHEPDHFGGWVMVKAEHNDPAHLIEALKAGAFYSSTGPEIKDVIWHDDTVDVTCTATRTIVVQGQGSRTVSHTGESITHLTLPLDQVSHSSWLRLTVLDAHGGRAWTNPVWRNV